MDGAFAHTCYRVLDPAASIKFYTECLGLEHVRAAPIRDEATNHFFAYAGDPEPWLELTHNHGRTEPYEIGTGYGHIAISVDDLDATLAALDEKGVQPERAPYLVGTTRICFVRDPDGYRIELIERAQVGARAGADSRSAALTSADISHVDENRRAGVAILPGATPVRRTPARRAGWSSEHQPRRQTATAPSGAGSTPRRNWPV